MSSVAVGERIELEADLVTYALAAKVPMLDRVRQIRSWLPTPVVQLPLN